MIKPLPLLFAFLLASTAFARSALAEGPTGLDGEPSSTSVIVSFPDRSTVFSPTPEQASVLAGAKDAAMISIRGRTSSPRSNAKGEGVALARALAARSYLVARGVSPLKISVNFASAADFIADNSTAEGRIKNQRAEVELIFVSAPE